MGDGVVQRKCLEAKRRETGVKVPSSPARDFRLYPAIRAQRNLLQRGVMISTLAITAPSRSWSTVAIPLVTSAKTV